MFGSYSFDMFHYCITFTVSYEFNHPLGAVRFQSALFVQTNLSLSVEILRYMYSQFQMLRLTKITDEKIWDGWMFGLFIDAQP